jgi:single-strand DNA-binding protein
MTNTWIGVGRLTRDPELRYAESGKAVAPMRIAVPRAGEGDSTDFFDVVAFGQLAEACATHLAKGRQVLIEGPLRQQSWTDNDSGERRSKVEIIANRVQFLDAPRREEVAEAAPDAA